MTRIHLRQLHESDLPQRVAWINDPAVNQHLSFDLPLTLSGSQEWFQGLADRPDRREYVAVADDTQELIGFGGFIALDPRVGSAELHGTIGAGLYRGRGYGSALYRELVRIGFEDLALNRVYCYQSVENFAAFKMVHRLGWQYEGLLREAGMYHGRLLDRHLWRLLKREWIRD